MKKERFADSASIAAAIAAGMCCIGPFVLVALGFGTIAGVVSAFFAPLRPYLLTVAFGIVSWRLFTIYLPAKPHVEDSSSVEEGMVCSIESRKNEKILTWSVFAIVGLFAASPYFIEFLPSPITSTQPVVTLNSTNPPAIVGKGDFCFSIKGMTCQGCAENIQVALVNVPGVKNARVSYDDGEACVAADKDSVRSKELINAISSVGYQAHLKIPKGVPTT